MKIMFAIAALCAAASSAAAQCIGPEIGDVCHGATIGALGRLDSEPDAFVRISPGKRVKPNSYGMGVGMDQYGMPYGHDPLWDGESGIFAPGGLGNIWIEP